MSHGLGVQERRIIDELETRGRVIVSLLARSDADMASLKRAARSLERKGLVGLTTTHFTGRDRLVVTTVDAARQERERMRQTRLAQARQRYLIAERELRELERSIDEHQQQ